MKLVLLLYLEEDEACVERLLRELDVALYSRLGIEGLGGAPGAWYGEPLPYDSRLVFAILPEDRAAALVEAVAKGSGALDARRHPVRAYQLPIEAASACQANNAGGPS